MNLGIYIYQSIFSDILLIFNRFLNFFRISTNIFEYFTNISSIFFGFLLLNKLSLIILFLHLI